ncbi:Rieske (2Fe-2S) protein, partial [Micrococcus luteus]|nr:Rieske (2Fe-2S) protein [Micrococcus luteus]
MTTQDSPLTPNSSRPGCCGDHARPDTSRRTVLGRG